MLNTKLNANTKLNSNTKAEGTSEKYICDSCCSCQHGTGEASWVCACKIYEAS